MTDDARAEQLSAYLDGGLAPAERTDLDADPTFGPQLASWRRARTAVAEVPAPDPAVRERAIAAALAQVPSPGSMPTTSPGSSPAPAGRPGRRRGSRTRHPLSIAAGLLAVAALGTVAVVALGGTDEAEPVADSPASIDGGTPESDVGPTDRRSEPMSDDVGTLMADDPPDESVDDEPEAVPEAGTTADQPADAADADGALPHVGPHDEDTLGRVVRDLVRDGAPAGADTSCGDVVDPVLATAEHLGRAVLVGPAPDRATARAVEPGTCTVLLEADLAG